VDHQYEFLKYKQNQILELSRQIQLLHESGVNQTGLRARVMDSLGDGMITCGYWMKRVSGSKRNQNSSVLVSQN
jgi:hypothetical protein